MAGKEPGKRMLQLDKKMKRSKGIAVGRQKRCRAVALSMVSVAVILSGCHIGKEFPVYPMETREDNSECLSIDGVEYRRDWGGNELAQYYNGGDVWTLADGLGEQIGVCGYKSESGGGFAIYEVAGDKERAVLYTEPRKFYFGGRDVRLWLREDVSLGPPTADMVSCITVSWSEVNGGQDGDEGNSQDDTGTGDLAEVQVQIEDPVLVEDLLESYCSGSDQAISYPFMGGPWIGCTLTLHHKDYPFLQYEIHGGYSPEQNKAYCQNDDLECFELSKEWAEVLKQARRIDPKCEKFGASGYQYKLNQPIQASFVRRVEERYGFTLPEGYFRFITEVGDGGAGPDYGIKPFTDFLEKGNSPGVEKFWEEYRLSLAKPFTPRSGVRYRQ